ncbi:MULTISPECIES: 50S ribosomal protein L32 [unclassified Mycoplasma]|uniref:50S ribosomal protein L32 n=1 Tax=unclassified Mycoplasma TaxID=2683645 RepID=UPI000FDDA854
MAVPKRKTSKSRKNKRRAHHAIKLPNLVNVSGTKVPHRLVKYQKRTDLHKTND